jgi:hypothetical protein
MGLKVLNLLYDIVESLKPVASILDFSKNFLAAQIIGFFSTEMNTNE